MVRIAGALCLASSAPSRAVLVRVFPSGRVSPLDRKSFSDRVHRVCLCF
jgi:hypothetical protein